MNTKDSNLIVASIKYIKLSLVYSYAFFLLKKNTELTNKKFARQRYCQSVCFFFGCIAPAIIRQSDSEAPKFIQFAVDLFNVGIKIFNKNFFYELDLNSNAQGGPSELNAEICQWFLENKGLPIITSIFQTGTHMMISTYDGNKIDKKTLNHHNKLGSLFSIENEPIHAFKIILVDNSFKTTF
jgi:hypothetical protein